MKVTSFAIAMLGFLITIIEPTAAARAESDEGKDKLWSADVNGLMARLVLKRTQVSNGTPIISTCLMLRNVSDVMNPISIPWNDKLMKFRVVDAEGNEGNKMGVFDGPVLDGTVTLVLPIRGELSFDFSSCGCGIPGDKAALICLGSDSMWTIEPNEGDYFLHAILEVAESNTPGGEPTRPWHGRIELPPFKIPLQGEPMDDATIEGRIKELGPKMLDANARVAEEAEREMSLIDDPRVIDWYLQLLATDQYGAKFRAVDRLSRFVDDRAFDGLKRATTTRGDDLGNIASTITATQSAENIRHFAFQALARSPHPDAKPLLLTMWNDPDASVRLTVLHALGKMDAPESLDLLQKMSADRDKMVRTEAQRYLKERQNSEDEDDSKP
jgi:hypothetical protein